MNSPQIAKKVAKLAEFDPAGAKLLTDLDGAETGLQILEALSAYDARNQESLSAV